MTTGRALVVGAPGSPPRGIEGDARRMAAVLERRGFEVDVRVGSRASRHSILAGYDDLIAKIGPGEPAVFYYSGHGFRAFLEGDARVWQGICPTDIHASTSSDFRGISAWELSIKQAQLTHKTKNVTTILDCCHAGQMSRGGDLHDAPPKELPNPLHTGFREYLAALRAQYGTWADNPQVLGNPDAVRVIACSPNQSAYDFPDSDGNYRSAFTDALVEVLTEEQDSRVSWAAVIDAIRRRVLRRFPTQRPDIEGPAQRRPFTLEEAGVSGSVVSIATRSEAFRIGAGALLGVSSGDVYVVMPSGSTRYRREHALADVKISEVFAMHAHGLARTTADHVELPLGSVAFLLEKVDRRWPVRIDGTDTALAAAETAIQASGTLRLAASEESDPIAILRSTGDHLVVEDSIGPLFPARRFPDELSHVVADLVIQGAAQAIRSREGEHGVNAHDLEIEWGTVEGSQMRSMPAHGRVLSEGDRIYIRVKNKLNAPRFLHILNIGLRGEVTLLTKFAPEGIRLVKEEPEHVLGRLPTGELVGLELRWPIDMPRSAYRRRDEIVVIITTTRTNLQSLETGIRSKPRSAAHPGDDVLAEPRQCEDSTGSAAPADGYLMTRLSYFLRPGDEEIPGSGPTVDRPLQTP